MGSNIILKLFLRFIHM